MCVDKTKAIFLSDVLEIADLNSEDFHQHDIFSNFCYTNRKEDQKVFYKAIGNVVITRENVVSIKLDSKAQSLFDEKAAAALERHQEDEKQRHEHKLKQLEEEKKLAGP